ncbi:glycoside hydrolase superfamily [Mycena haematopus]|nr:glycoside hydrolase superfamily [Mycena haematopus]
MSFCHLAFTFTPLTSRSSSLQQSTNPPFLPSAWTNVCVDETGIPVAEPFLEGVPWPYIVRLLGWARKYGLRVHTAPGSQNGALCPFLSLFLSLSPFPLPRLLFPSFLPLPRLLFRSLVFCSTHLRAQATIIPASLARINFLNGPMGFANAQRMLDYIRVIVEFVTQPQYANLVPMFQAFLPDIGRDVLTSFYLQAHTMIRGITGIGEEHGPFISIHDGFQGVSSWAGFLPGSDRIILDTHPYFAFDGALNNAPIATGLGTGEDGIAAGGIWQKQACSSWGASLNTSRVQFGVTVAGEFSNGYNDCGLYLTGVNGRQSYGGDRSLFMDASTCNDRTKAGVKAFALASMDATQDCFFWTWKIGAVQNGVVQSPLWSHSLGLQNEFIPTDLRDSVGVCAALDVSSTPFNGTFQPWQTGGAGAGTIAASDLQTFGAWSPATLSSMTVAPTLLPTYSPTASIPSLTWATPTPTAAGSASASGPTITASAGSGWFDAADTALAMTAVAGCTYPDAWSALGSTVPAVCTGTPTPFNRVRTWTAIARSAPDVCVIHYCVLRTETHSAVDRSRLLSARIPVHNGYSESPQRHRMRSALGIGGLRSSDSVIRVAVLVLLPGNTVASAPGYMMLPKSQPLRVDADAADRDVAAVQASPAPELAGMWSDGFGSEGIRMAARTVHDSGRRASRLTGSVSSIAAKTSASPSSPPLPGHRRYGASDPLYARVLLGDGDAALLPGCAPRHHAVGGIRSDVRLTSSDAQSPASHELLVPRSSAVSPACAGGTLSPLSLRLESDVRFRV